MMHVQIPSTTIRPVLALAKPDSLPADLRVGQVVNATVSRIHPDSITLEVAGRQLEVRTSLPLRQGQEITLRLESEAGRLFLRVLADARDLRGEALRTALPKQAPPEVLIQRLEQLTLRGHFADLPREVREVMARLRQSLPTPKQLTEAEGLRQVIRDSGLFLESRLAASDREFGHDFKAQLLRLLDALRRQQQGRTPATAGSDKANAETSKPSRSGVKSAPVPIPGASKAPTAASPPGRLTGGVSSSRSGGPGSLHPTISGSIKLPISSISAIGPAPTSHVPPAVQGAPAAHPPLLMALFKLVESSVARLQTQQLTSGSTPERPDEPSWLLEIPVRDRGSVEPLRIRIRREKGRQGGGGECWSVVLRFAPHDYGDIRIVVTLIANVVSTRFQAERADTAALFQTHIDRLRERLAKQGLEVGQLGAYQGIPDIDEDGPELDLVSGLLSEKA